MIEVKRLKKKYNKNGTYCGWYRKSSMILSLPLGWLKKTNKDQWMSHVLCWRDWRGELTVWTQPRPRQKPSRAWRQTRKKVQKRPPKGKEKKESHFISQICFKTVILMLFSSSKQRNHLGFQRNTDNDLTQIQVLKQSDECVWQEIKRHSRAVLQVKCQYGSLCKGI